VFIQHYELDSPAGKASQTQPFETHTIWIGEDRCHQAAAYRWDTAGLEANLVEEGDEVAVPREPKRHWFSPGREECLNLELATLGFVLQVNARQLNRDVIDRRTGREENQLQVWDRRGLFDPPLDTAALDSLPRLVALDDATQSVEQRVRSFLDANCAFCHRPGGLARGLFDARFTTPLADQQLIQGELMAGDLGIPGAKVIVPGRIDKSILYQRVKRTDFFRMPPVAFSDEPSPLLPFLREWIEMMK
jgi:hypothetical protein